MNQNEDDYGNKNLMTVLLPYIVTFYTDMYGNESDKISALQRVLELINLHNDCPYR